MKNSLLFISTLIIMQSFSCSKKTEELLFDEIIYSEYKIGLLSNTVFHFHANPLSVTKSIITDEDYIKKYSRIEKPYYISKNPHIIFIPINVLKITRNGESVYFEHSGQNNTGNKYSSYQISQSGINYINTLLNTLENKTIDSIYYKEHIDMIYDGSYYYLSFLKNNKEIHTHIYYLNDASKEIKRLIEYFQYFVTNKKFKSSNKVTMLDKYFLQIFNSDLKSNPFNIIKDSVSTEYTPTIKELKKY